MPFPKRVLAVDADGVVYDHRTTICQYLRYRWNIIMPPEQLLSNNPAHMTNDPEVNLDIIEQFKNPPFYQYIKPFPWAYETLWKLKDLFNLVLLSNRPNHLKGTNYECCRRDFPWAETPTESVFQEIHCLEKTAKWKAAKTLRAFWAVDDNPTNALEYAKHNIGCFLVGGKQGLFPQRYVKPVQDLRGVLEFFERLTERTA